MFANSVSLALFFSLLLLGCAHGNEKNRKKSKVIEEYLITHHDFHKAVCASGDRAQYELLNKKYRGFGHYLPEWKGNIDIVALKASISHIDKKLEWIKQQLEQLKSKESLPKYSEISKELQISFQKVMTDKWDYDLSPSESKKKEIREKAKINVKEFIQEFEKMLDQIPFMKNFMFPIDHLKNRITYDKTNVSKKEKDQHKSKELYLLRKLMEDGAMNPNRTQSDKFTRTMLDTLALEIPQLADFISENIRYDLKSFLKSLEFHLNQGRQWQIDRFEEWLLRTSELKIFYLDLIAKYEADSNSTKELILNNEMASKALEDFVIERQLKTYQFWKNKSDQMKSLYVMETIFTNEVGPVDGPGGLERRDVGQVVLNRLDQKKMTNLVKNQRLYRELSRELSDDEIQNEKWLNIMFRLGEFSFTYYFIPGVSHIFCPDESTAGKKLRKENAKIALKLMERPNPDFKAGRYFSRESMIGRIDISELWNDFKPYPERPGVALKQTKKWQKKYQKGNYQYLYSYLSTDNKTYQVLDFEGKTMVIHKNGDEIKFFNYRNPHHFKYFHKK